MSAHEQPSTRIRACVAVVRDGKILLVPHYDTDASPVQWVIPGGRVRFGESLIDAAGREFREETGFAVEITDLLDVSEVVKQEAQYHSITVSYRGEIVGGCLAPEAGHRHGAKVPVWFSAQEIEQIAFHPPTAVRKALEGSR